MKMKFSVFFPFSVNIQTNLLFYGGSHLYKKVMKNNWIFDNKNISIARKRIYVGKESLLVNTQPYSWLSTKQIKTIGKPLHMRFKDPFLLSARSLVLPKNGPFTGSFGKFIGRATASGLFQQIKYKEIIKGGVKSFLFRTPAKV